MSTALIPVADLRIMAEAFAKSKIFGARSPEEALSLMLVAQAEGMHPAAAARDYHIIQGKASKKAEAMLRDFLAAGGKVEWHALDDTTADATFSHQQGGTARIKWDMKRVQTARISNEDMYRKYPRQMLRSRCVSEGVRTICPVATGGMYTPEEVPEIVHGEKVINPRLSEEELATWSDAILSTDTKDAAKAKWREAAAICKSLDDVDSAEKLKTVMLRHAVILDGGDPDATQPQAEKKAA